MTAEVLALALTLAVHIVGAFALIGVLVRNSGADVRDWWPGDDDGGPPPDDPQPQRPQPGGGGGVPLPDAQASPVRLREPGQISERYPRPARRPAHPPAPAPERQPEHG
ncbi:hypothetical protein [Capillimicrobium parvum]|uniref:Uncharacterized protein n=1 Tax=Capillimicrobium parvum TaxID=2884022 RepID=A0A9E6XWS4_9ACTN|nr:hypothetical protein [Capillimicrobium parvum]UGS35824.1 hypothetical protein DSM104329_02221 [Capillimicrobium parvum]